MRLLEPPIKHNQAAGTGHRYVEWETHPMLQSHPKTGTSGPISHPGLLPRGQITERLGHLQAHVEEHGSL